MAVHARNEKLGLRLRKSGALLLSPHEVGRLPERPGPLRFIEDRDMLIGRPRVDQQVVTKVMHVLDERLHTLGHFSLSRANAKILLPTKLITSQRFAKHGNERTVPRKENSMRRLMDVAALSGDVKT